MRPGSEGASKLLASAPRLAGTLPLRKACSLDRSADLVRSKPQKQDRPATMRNRSEIRALLWTEVRAPCLLKLSKRSEEHTSELQSLRHLVCRLLLEKKKQ